MSVQHGVASGRVTDPSPFTAFGWGALSHEHFGLKAFGASGRECELAANVIHAVSFVSPVTAYDKVYEKFEITPEGIATRAEKVVSFYKNRGHPIYSPLISALGGVDDE